MTEKDLETRVRDLISTKLDVDTSQVVDSASFADDLKADSLDLVELVMALEEEFDIVISDQDQMKILKVGDAINYIKKYVA